MARDHARLYLSIWTDEDFRVLSTPAKLLYLHLCSQDKLSYAGVHSLTPKRWARAHPDLGVEGVRAALGELDAARFVVIDHDTEELLVRSFIRRDELWRQPNMLRAALRVAFEIESPILRAALAAELLRLPAEITGPAPAVAARELGTTAATLPAGVKAAFDTRPRRTCPPTTTTPDAPAEIPEVPRAIEPARTPSPTPSGNPSPNPSAMDLGEGSRERETGEPRLTLEDQGGVPARTRVSAHSREAAPVPDERQADAEPVSARQSRRVEAERLVTVHTPAQPRRVRDRLRGEVIGLLAEGVEPAVIAAGLRAWSCKRLPVSWLPELVAEHQRAAVVGAAPEQRARAVAAAEGIERIRADAIAEDDRSPVGLAVRELPAHADPDTLDAVLAHALAATMAFDGRGELARARA
ncbi:hypothetical protein [Actinokineospora iranica]|uniref:Uncharacterized protein n=1 Tax=Actinokineospora iranica TaxID=1271860 RepID=A0A1G6K2A2_9PSEU|nr:hypothetical protein [Actinokineospora iranica]SDC25159.1 hypothetical protein SAMN05216174_101680 [Actinokineospora iranica]